MKKKEKENKPTHTHTQATQKESHRVIKFP